MKPKTPVVSDDMRAEYDFDYSKGVRGKYYKRMQEGPTNVVILDPDVAEAFPNSRAVHKALRSLMRAKRPRRTARKRAA
jgi:hypothetical protein